MRFSEIKIDDRVYIQSDDFNKLGGVKHCFTTRLGGMSRGHIEGLNFGFRVKDDHSSVVSNYKLTAKDLGFSFDRMVLAKQTHTDNIRIVTEADCGKGITVESDIEDTDGLITSCVNVPLVVFSADCTPILMYDAEKNVAAAIHSGWRGTVKKIAARAVEIMKTEFKCNPKDIFAAIGPHIRSCCFEVDIDVSKNFNECYVTVDKASNKATVDLLGVNISMLEDCGILSENISYSDECTKCRSDKFYSYRADKERTGRMCAIIQIV